MKIRAATDGAAVFRHETRTALVAGVLSGAASLDNVDQGRIR
jgi:alpha-acetolactate decarboxylase